MERRAERLRASETPKHFLHQTDEHLVPLVLASTIPRCIHKRPGHGQFPELLSLSLDGPLFCILCPHESKLVAFLRVSVKGIDLLFTVWVLGTNYLWALQMMVISSWKWKKNGQCLTGVDGVKLD